MIVGAGLVGLETASILAEEGRAVICVDPLPDPGAEMEPILRKLLFKRFANLPNLEIRLGTRIEAFGAEGVRLEREGERETIPPVDQVVIAAGGRPNDALATELRGWPGRLEVIGDAREPGNIERAFSDGLALG